MVLLGILVGDILFNAGAHVFLKLGAMRSVALAETKPGLMGAVQRMLLNPWSVLGMGAYGASFLFYAALLAKMDLSLAYPLCTSIAFLMVLVASIGLFGERLNRWRAGGVGAIFVGIVLLAVG